MILEGLVDKVILNSLRKITKPIWDSSLAEVIAYRDAILAAQQHTCAYCQRPIFRNELGFRELDHILPKSQRPSDGLDINKARSNDKKLRRHTQGYHDFRYVPENLVIACKRCNSFKGSYDALTDRQQT